MLLGLKKIAFHGPDDGNLAEWPLVFAGAVLKGG
jgi:hypothetical protein